MQKVHFLFFILLYQLTIGQTAGEKLIHGKIMVESGQVAGVTIINLVNEKSVISDTNGEFYILAKADDLLVFSSVNLGYHRKQIEEEDLKKEVIIIKMTSKITELDEVIVNKHPEINAVDLGISKPGIKKYTPVERKLYTAGEFHWYSPLLITLGGMDVDGMLNAINGRTAMLKKDLEVEKKQHLLVVLNSLFDDNYFKETLKIPTDYVKGFQYYCVEDPKFRDVLNTKNKTQIAICMVPLAEKFNEINSDEN